MIEKVIHNKLIFIIVHIIIGYLATYSFFPKIYSSITILYFIAVLFFSNNEKEEASIFSAYIVGAEVFLRMTDGYISYETGKYSVIIFLILGIFTGRFKQVFSVQYIFYILLLLLGIVFTQVPQGESIRNAIVFNLSGPIVLGLAAFYFYKRPLSKEKVFNILFFMLLPIFSTISYLYFRTQNLEEIVFGTEASFAASGGFGPNQVATSVGLGIVIITIFILTKRKLTGFLILDYIFLIYFTFRGLLTFSRGGILTAALCVLFFSVFFILYKKVSLAILFKYIATSAFFIIAIWLYTSDVTKGMLNNRYTGKNALGVQQQDITTGRLDIFEVQLDNFLDYPFGIGVGNGKYERLDGEKKVAAASHNEVGRLLEEHGYIGLILLLLLLIIPLFNFYRSNNYQKAFIASFYIMWFLTINHSAMRVAMPGFIYALSLIIITNIEDEEDKTKEIVG